MPQGLFKKWLSLEVSVHSGDKFCRTAQVNVLAGRVLIRTVYWPSNGSDLNVQEIKSYGFYDLVQKKLFVL